MHGGGSGETLEGDCLEGGVVGWDAVLMACGGAKGCWRMRRLCRMGIVIDVYRRGISSLEVYWESGE